MTSIQESIRRMLKPVEPLPAGVYHYIAPQDDPRNYRLHLRLEQDGRGVLIINAATVLHLNQTAAEYAYHLVKGTPLQETGEKVASRYRTSREQALADFYHFKGQVETLIETPDLDPVTFLDLDRRTPYTGSISAPYRLDCALTYALSTDQEGTSAPTKRVDRELTTQEWLQVIDQAWDKGIPHIVFTGGEPTLREDLVELIQRSEDNGQVTGLLTDGLRLADSAYLETLLQTGLDHLLIIFRPDKEDAWTSLKNALDSDLFTAVHLTITPDNNASVTSLLDRLSEVGVQAISLSINAPGLETDLDKARDYVANLDLPLIWDLPVPYSALNPVTLEVQSEDQPEGAGKAWLYIEPDGDVLPAQGVNQVLGNILRDPWAQIWENAAQF